MFKQRVYIRGHILANKIDGSIRKSRFVLYEKLNGIAGRCHWCGIELTWKTLCADHLDSNIMNDTAENLVGSCRGCNANREDGTGRGRQTPKRCRNCKVLFIGGSHHKQQIYCSLKCSKLGRIGKHYASKVNWNK